MAVFWPNAHISMPAAQEKQDALQPWLLLRKQVSLSALTTLKLEGEEEEGGSGKETADQQTQTKKGNHTDTSATVSCYKPGACKSM